MNLTSQNIFAVMLSMALLILAGCSDSSSNSVTGDTDPKQPGPGDPCPQPPAAGLSIRINEAMVDNVTTLPDTNGNFFPWVEFYNPGPEAMDLGGAYFSDSLADNQKWVFPCQFQETILQPGEFLVLFFGGDGNPDDLHIDFMPELTGDQIWVLNQSSDFFSFNADDLASDQSAGRFPDGDSVVEVLSAPTPGNPNADPVGPALFVRGDLDFDLDVDEDDLNLLSGHFAGSPISTECADRLDVNDSGTITVSDVSFLVQALAGNLTIPEPFPAEGLDPTPDNIDCEGP
ncbi:MAG: lamin tail domain-containing protein [Planctomycetes bacterium]|nr:lamin tail domain-containing protein [Planctomycetota bacterium]